MGRYLKKFSTNNEYQNYINDKSKLILPNVSLVEGDAYCYFIPNQIGEPGQPTPEPEVVLTPTIHATFNATSENMMAFMETGNIKSLKIDGNQIDVGVPVPTQGSLNVVGNDITVNMETNEAVVSPEYLVNTSDADFVSLKFTPTDKNISFDDYNAFALIMEMDGVVQAMPIPMQEMGAMYMQLGLEYQSESHTVIVPQYFLTYLKMAAQMSPTGLTGVFIKVNLENETIENFLDTTCNYYTVSGGLAGQYAFDTEGTHEVEIELTDNSPTDMLFAMSCVSDIISMKNIKSIAPHTFTSCSNLEEIAIPNDVTEIHCMAIANTPITEFTIPDSVSYVGVSAFASCENLTSITIPDSVTTIGSQAFNTCSSLTEITIPSSVTSIGYEAFGDCTNLTSVDLGNGITSIGDYVFNNCTSLTEITIPEGITSIGDYVFNNCTSLTEITIPEGVTSIGTEAFYYCTSLTSVYCKPTTPPAGGSSMFNNNASGRKIYVPMASVDAYKSAEYWSGYSGAIEGYNF